jgi:CHAP domain
MSLESTIQRVAALSNAIADPALLLGGKRSISTAFSSTGGTQAPSGNGTFASALEQASAQTPASGSYAAAPGAIGEQTGVPPTYTEAATGISTLTPAGASQAQALGGPDRGGSPGERIVAIAESQVGQTEQPPGSNESPAIAQYRSATAGAIPGAPWCAYFASWVARQAGEPLGSQGEGLGAVSEIWSWAQSAGRAVPNGPGVMPKPGDLIVFGDEHVGIVKQVLPDGNIETIEGNYENKVSLNVRSPSEPTGYVNMS